LQALPIWPEGLTGLRGLRGVKTFIAFGPLGASGAKEFHGLVGFQGTGTGRGALGRDGERPGKGQGKAGTERLEREKEIIIPGTSGDL